MIIARKCSDAVVVFIRERKFRDKGWGKSKSYTIYDATLATVVKIVEVALDAAAKKS